MNVKLIAADIDGTLLNKKRELTSATIAAVRAAIEKGVYFVLATGRPIQAVRGFSEVLGLEKMPFILYNGAMAMMDGEVLYSLTFPAETARMVVEEGHKRNSTMICWANNKLYSETVNEKINFYKSFSGVEPIVLKSLADVADEGAGITKFVWYDDDERTKLNFDEFSETMGDRLNVHPSQHDFLEFVNKDCSKAIAMQKICEKLGIDVKDTVAIGDGFNDLSMLRFAGLGVAMGNADERIKKECGYVTDGNDNDGAAKFIEKFVL